MGDLLCGRSDTEPMQGESTMIYRGADADKAGRERRPGVCADKGATEHYGIYLDTYLKAAYISSRKGVESVMSAKTAKLFTTGRSQAVRLPMEFRFEGKEVFVRRDPRTGDVILSRKPDSWDGLFALHDKGEVPNDFMSDADRDQSDHDRDPFAGWLE